MVPDEGRKWVMETINASWRGYKCRVKKNHYYAYKTDALRWEHRPKTISESQFRDLLDYWDCSVVEVVYAFFGALNLCPETNMIKSLVVLFI